MTQPLTPSPRHAGHIWASPDGTSLMLGLPSESGTGHTLRFPATEAGAQALLATLRARASAQALPRLNQAGAPSQAVLDGFREALAQDSSHVRRVQVGLSGAQARAQAEAQIPAPRATSRTAKECGF